MANELTLNTSLALNKGGATPSVAGTRNAQYTVAGFRYVRGLQSVGTSEEALGIGELASLGYAWFKNLDGTNFVTIKTGTGGVNMVKIKAGETAVFRFGSGVTAPFAIADTAAVKLDYMIVED